MKKKGMSQTLALIVAASVLMMTALTVIFLAQGALGDFGTNSAQSSCRSAVISQCQTTLASTTADSPTIDTPGVCVNSEDQTVVSSAGSHDITGTGADGVTCNS